MALAGIPNLKAYACRQNPLQVLPQSPKTKEVCEECEAKP